MCFSMYSDMSMRIIACSSSNRNAASALHNSVLPTPVGPRNRNRPSGRFGSWRPARARRGVANRDHGLVLPDHAGVQLVFHLQQLVALALEHLVDRMPVQRETTWAMSLSDDLLVDHTLRLLLLRLGKSLLEVRDHAVGELARTVEITAPRRLLQLRTRVVELLLELLRLGVLALLGLPLGGERGRLLLGVGQLLLELPRRSRAAGSSSFLSASRSILSCMIRRSSCRRSPRAWSRSPCVSWLRPRRPGRSPCREEAIRDVAMAEGRRGDDRAVGDPHAVAQLVLLA